MKIERLEKSVGHIFKDRGLLVKALTHRSHAFERHPGDGNDNELLEFLGDSVVGLITAEFYLAAFPGKTEGELSKLKASATSTLALSKLARKIRLDKFILLGRGEEKSGGRDKISILAGAFEALTGAVYLDGGFEDARRFVSGLLSSTLKPIRKAEPFEINNYKSALQELFQKSGQPSPCYRMVTETGPQHKKTFVVEVRQADKVLAKAKGSSKKSAEQKAAQKALRKVLGRKMKEISAEAFIVGKGI